MQVHEFVSPAGFAAYKAAAEELGFAYVASGPLVRSSYRAGELFLANMLQEAQGEQVAAVAG